MIINCLNKRAGEKITEYNHHLHKSKIIGLVNQLVSNENRFLKAGVTLELADKYINVRNFLFF
jgi:hypothetical protein